MLRLFSYDMENKKILNDLPKLKDSENVIDCIVFANVGFAKAAFKGTDGDLYFIAVGNDSNGSRSLDVYTISNLPKEGVCISKGDYFSTYYSFDTFKDYLFGKLFPQEAIAKKYSQVDFPAVFDDVKEMLKSFLMNYSKDKIQIDFIPSSIIATILSNLNCKMGEMIAQKEGLMYLKMMYYGKLFAVGIAENSILIAKYDYFINNLVKKEILKV